MWSPADARYSLARVRNCSRKMPRTRSDDNVDAAELLAAVLEHAGYQAEVCHDGLEALERIVGAPPDLAVVDLGLPGIDGLEVATLVRERLGERAPRLIAVTGYGAAEDRQRTERAGFEAHLTKPIEAAQLLRAIERPAG